MFSKNLINQIYIAVSKYCADRQEEDDIFVDVETLKVYSTSEHTPKSRLALMASKEMVDNIDKYKAIIEMALYLKFN